VYVDREGKMPGCTEKRTKANQKMLNKMAARAEGFYWQTNAAPKPILEDRESLIVDRIINNHFDEIGSYGDFLSRRREISPEKKVDPEFLNWVQQELPTLQEDKLFDAMFVIGPAKFCEYVIEGIQDCKHHKRPKFCNYFLRSEDYTRCSVDDKGEKTPPSKEQLITEITKFTRQEEMKCQIRIA